MSKVKLRAENCKLQKRLRLLNALTSLTDKDVPDCMKQAYLRELKKIK